MLASSFYFVHPPIEKKIGWGSDRAFYDRLAKVPILLTWGGREW